MQSRDKINIRWSVRPKSIGDPDFLTQLGKVPPQAVEIEEAVLGALMLERDALSSVIEILKPESFYKGAHQEIYSAIVKLFKDSQPVDILTVTNHLRSIGKLDAVGGPYYITNLTSRVNSSANIEYHARIIIEHAIKREVIRIGCEMQQEGYDESADAFLLLDKSEKSIFEISENNTRKNYQTARVLMSEAIRQIESKKDSAAGVTGIPSGFNQLDRMTGGWQKSDLIIVAARPAMGKTAFVLSVLRNAAIDFKKPVGIFSLEMSAVQLMNRMIACESEIDNEKIKRGMLESYEWEQLIYMTAKLTEAPIFIDDTPALTILELRAKARRLVARHKVEMIIVDYLQLMSGERENYSSNREQEIASISRALKNLSKELDIPVIAVSQLSRAVELRSDKRPQLSDLRESGAIEQDADMVIFLFRPEYYGINEDINGNLPAGICEVIISKNRNGGTGSLSLKFISRLTKFLEIIKDEQIVTAKPTFIDFKMKAGADNSIIDSLPF